jgi:hypothetical protein
MPNMIKHSLKFLGKLIAAVGLLYALVFGWLWWDVSKVKGFCSELRPGLQVGALQALAQRHGIAARLKLPGIVEKGSGNWLTIVPSHATMGESACFVSHNQISVLSTSFQGPGGR